MSPERFGIRMNAALKERNARAVLRLLRLAMREGDRRHNFGWRWMVLVPLGFAAFFGLSAFAGEAWAWASVAIVVLF